MKAAWYEKQGFAPVLFRIHRTAPYAGIAEATAFTAGLGFAPFTRSQSINTTSTSCMGLIQRDTTVSYWGITNAVKLLVR